MTPVRRELTGASKDMFVFAAQLARHALTDSRSHLPFTVSDTLTIKQRSLTILCNL